MSDLGIAFAWLAVQVALLLAPTTLLHAWASRRGPAAGAWVATVALAMVVALSAAAWPAGRLRRGSTGPVAEDRDSPAPTAVAGAAIASARPPAPGPVRSWRLAGLGLAWERIGREASAPAERCRPWGGVLAALATAGVGVGFVRIGLGLAAVRSCRRRSVAVSDRDLIALRDELAAALGFARRVEIREARDLPGPAAAGWLRPAVLLPADWRTWDEAERRAVLAHELAHVARGDYAAALLARAAVALHFYHPMVRRTAGRLMLQQEQAADALAARLAGGGAAYLAALSRLALRQDGRPPGWARAFLAGRGTLIRRIAMLREHDSDRGFDRPAPRRLRLATAALMAASTLGVAALRGPAYGEEPTPTPTPSPGGRVALPYVNEGSDGMVSIRPAAAFRRGGETYASLIREVGREFLEGGTDSDFARLLKVDMADATFLRLGIDDVEWLTSNLQVSRVPGPEGNELHGVGLFGTTIRTKAAFDWPAFLRQWKFDLIEAREAGHAYYRIGGSWARILSGKGGVPAVLVVDDRTIVVDDESSLRAALRGERETPAYLRGADWARAERSLFAAAIDNHGGSFEKSYDRGGHEEDRQVLEFFRGVDHWVFELDDADALAARFTASCRDEGASGALAGRVEPWLTVFRAWDELNPTGPVPPNHEKAFRLLNGFANGLHVEPASGRSVTVRSAGFGSFMELVGMLDAEIKEEYERDRRRDEQVKRTRQE